MNDLFIYCLTSKQYNHFKYLPSNIIPLGLGENIYPENFLNEQSGTNIVKHNKYLAEMTGIYWVYKNQMNKFKNDDWIGFCHYRRFWLNDFYKQNHKIKSSLYSKLLIDSQKLKKAEVILAQPTKLKRETIIDHFINNHGDEMIFEAIKILDGPNATAFKNYLNNREFSCCNMFIARPKVFIAYCEFVFPYLLKILDYCKDKNLCVGKNTKLPAYFIERFTSFWFHKYANVSYLSYAQLNNFFSSNILNNLINTFKVPGTFMFYPTVLDI